MSGYRNNSLREKGRERDTHQDLLRARGTHLVAKCFEGKLDVAVEFPARGVAEGVAPGYDDLSLVVEAFGGNGSGNEEGPSLLGIDVDLLLPDVDNLAKENAP